MAEAEISGEEALIQARREKANKLREGGVSPFANDRLVGRSTVSEVLARFSPGLREPHSERRYDAEVVLGLAQGQRFTLYGRLMARRGFGKAVFLQLRDESGSIQLFAKQDILGAGFQLLESLDVADHVEVSGTIIVTKTQELTLQVESLRLLTKALRPLPDKWHGLTDVDLRYRRRYVDLIANPSVASVFELRSLTIQGIRSFLDAQGFLEVETPTLHQVVGGAAAKPFNTHHNALDLELFLRIAPELHLKRLLVGGFERVYEIGRCYRNEGISTRHNPEFTILEFYQAYATYQTLMPMAEALFRSVDAFVAAKMAERGRADAYAAFAAERPFTLAEPFARVPLKQAIERGLQAARLSSEALEGLQAAVLAPDAGKEEGAVSALVASFRSASERASRIDWRNLCQALRRSGSAGEREFVAYEYVAEPFLAEDYRSQDGSRSVPVFIIDYPAAVSPLARCKDEDPTLVDRFELFVDGRELCNAFSELNDPDDQEARFREQVERKRQGHEETMDFDEDYILALQHGMPPAAGFGMGIDRFVMALAAQPSIRDVIAFPLLRPEA